MRRTFLAALSGIAVAACGGKLAPSDAGANPDSNGGDGGDASTATDSGDAGGDADGAVACDYDASDDAACTTPADDRLFASPAAVQVAAGSYGLATFVATGPWASAPSFYIWYESSTLPLAAVQQVTTYGSPQSVPFLVAAGSAGQKGTLTVRGRAGNVERTAQVAVSVTACVPWPASMVCAPNQNCGFQGDGCGGLLSCGTCGGLTPYCFLGTCQASAPVYCPPNEGYGGNGTCVPCGTTKTCQLCDTGECFGIQDVCICEPPNHGGAPTAP